MAYVNRMGGTHSIRLYKVAREIWQWCETRNLTISASYIPSKENIEADYLSRVHNVDTEWELCPVVFGKIVRKFGRPEIDIFASRTNSKLERYISWHRDPNAETIDAFTVNWERWFFYAFPPFAIVLKTLRKICAEGARGIVVVPYWPSQPWFPLFRSMLISDVLIFKPRTNLLLSPCRSTEHSLAHQLSVMVGVLSGQLFNGKA